jgi:uncharacterized protein YgbK (DUF1537 family)
MSLVFGAIADDLTGGLELAAMLRAEGVTCEFLTKIDGAVDTEAVVVARRTRVAPPALACAEFEAIGSWLIGQRARQLFFKYCATFDSTPAGNIGPCADVLRRLTESRMTAFCPSFPEAGRRVFQGHLFTDDRLVSESPKRYDPLTPMTDPDLVRVLQSQTKTRVGLIPQQIVRAGLPSLEAHCIALASKGIEFVVADAATPDDLAAIARLTVSWPLMTGNSSIAAYYPSLWRSMGLLRPSADSRKLPGVGGPGVVLAGSCAEQTQRQLEVFALSRPLLTIDLQHVESEDQACERALEWALQRLDSGPIAIATSAGPESVAAIQAKLGQRRAADLAENILSSLAERLRDAGVRRFLIAGGETSGAIIERLGIGRLTVGSYRAPGISHALSEGPTPLAFCLKGGKLGPEDMFLEMLSTMERGEQ